MKCVKCGADLASDVKFCKYCGTKVEMKKRFCRECGSELAEGVKFCANCGAKVDFVESQISETRSAMKSEIGGDIHKENNHEEKKPFLDWNRVQKESQKKSKSKKKSSKGGVLALALVVVFLFISLAFMNSSSSNHQEDSISDGYNQSNVSQAKSEKVEDEVTDEITETPVEQTNYTIEKGRSYAFMSDEWNVYIATAISDSVIKIEHWDKTMSSTKKMSFSEDIGSYKINDSENGFSWIDDEHLAFNFIFQDKNNSRVKKPASHTFTININDSDVCKGSDYDEQIASYSYTNDDWHMYRAIPLSDHLIKIECWARGSSLDKFLFGWDWCVIDTNNTDTDFEWTDDEHTSFTITTKDPENDYYWKKETFVAFELENEEYKYSDVNTYLGLQVIGEDEAKVPKSSSDFKHEDYKEVQDSLSSAGFTNIQTEVLYDIVFGWTDEGEVEDVSIDGNTDYEEGDVFKKNATIIISYHMNEEDDPNKVEENTDAAKESEKTESTEEPSEITEEITEEENVPAENLTIDNCPELAAMLSNKAEMDQSYSTFASQYKGRNIEFDGRIDYCTNHENYNTRFDYLVSAGDYDPDHQIGPSFKFNDVSYSDLNTNLETVSVGLNVHIVAEVVSYDSSNGLFYLKPVSVTGR